MPIVPDMVFSAVAQTSPDHPGGGLRAQREAIAIPIVEGVHLLLNDVRRLTDGPPIELRSLQHGNPQTVVAIGVENGCRSGFDGRPAGTLLRQNIIHPADRLDELCHSALVPGLEDHESGEITFSVICGNLVWHLIDQYFDAAGVAEKERQRRRRCKSCPRPSAAEPIK